MQPRRNHKNRNKAKREQREREAAHYGLPVSQGSPGLLRLLRKAASMTPEQAATANDMSKAAWERMECGMTPVSVELIGKLCEQLGMDDQIKQARLFDELGSIQRAQANAIFSQEKTNDKFVWFINGENEISSRLEISKIFSIVSPLDFECKPG